MNFKKKSLLVLLTIGLMVVVPIIEIRNDNKDTGFFEDHPDAN